MKKITMLLISVFCTIYSYSQYTTVADTAFENILIERGLDSGVRDGKVLTASIDTLTNLRLEYRQVSDLSPLKDFIALKSLTCLGLNVSSIDLTKNTELESLEINSLKISTIDLTTNTKLKKLLIEDPQISTLQISNCTELTNLTLFDVLLSSLDLSNQTIMTKLNCWNTQISNIIFPQDNQLNEISIMDCKIESANFPGDFSLLTSLCISGNPLNNIDLSIFPNLSRLICYENTLQSLDVSELTKLTQLDCRYNQLTSLDLSKNSKLSVVDCSDNLLSSLQLPNNITSGTDDLHELDCSRNKLSTLDLSLNTNLTHLNCNNNYLESLDLSNNIKLTGISCSFNKLTTLNVNKCPQLVNLFCDQNNLINLDLSNNPLILELVCQYNQLTILDLSQNKNLSYLYCSNNDIERLDFSLIPTLVYFDCSSNNLNYLNIRNINKENVFNFYSYNNPDLECIIVDDLAYAYENWTDSMYFGIDYYTQFSTTACGANTITGYVYFDNTPNCTINDGYKGKPDFFVKATGKNEAMAITDENGFYLLHVDSLSTYQLSVVPTKYQSNVKSICPPITSTISTGSSGNEVSNVNFEIEYTNCPLLSVEISKGMMRRCFPSTTSIFYQNEGFGTATNVEVFLQLPEHVRFISSSIPAIPVGMDDDLYKFHIGNLEPFAFGYITITDSVICDDEDIRGFTQCMKAWITPKNGCGEVKDTSAWDKSSIVVKTKVECEDGVAKFNVINSGSGNMLTAHQYRVYFDNELIYTGTFKLNSGENMIVDVPADGSTIRLEADQHPLHPGNSRPRATIEGCGVFSVRSASLGFWPQAPADDLDYEISEVCLDIRDSYDPNDKKVSPAGVTESNYVPEKEPLTYTIRFQNTGSDFAYNISITDTLSKNLDMSTFKVESASHPYTYTLTGDTISILTFKFKNIMLPDSTTNEEGSHGFVSFVISPKQDIAPGTSISNFADIYFDYNSAVRTDTAAVIAKDTVIASTKNVTVTQSATSIDKISDKDKVTISPNPASNFISIVGLQKTVNAIEIVDVNGRIVKSVSVSADILKVDIKELTTGTYFIKTVTNKENEYIGSFIKK